MTARAPSSADVSDAIAATNREFQSAFAGGDAAGIASCYTSTAILLPPGSDVVSGTDGIRGFWEGVLKLGIKAARLETLEVEGHGDVAHELGRYTLEGEGGREVDRGKYLVLWREDRGRWKLHRDIWNSSGQGG
jgi:ketosteroid isomerase-like protein